MSGIVEAHRGRGSDSKIPAENAPTLASSTQFPDAVRTHSYARASRFSLLVWIVSAAVIVRHALTNPAVILPGVAGFCLAPGNRRFSIPAFIFPISSHAVNAINAISPD
jgi:hypothetical protein